MKEYNKSSKLEHVAYDIRGPVLEEAMRMRANGEKILRLNTGNPAEFGFTAPDEVIHDLIMNARDSEGYSDSKGIFSARKAIMQYCQLKKFPNVDIDDIRSEERRVGKECRARRAAERLDKRVRGRGRER